MYAFIYEGQIVGISPDSGGTPEGWEALPMPEGAVSLQQVYLKDGALLMRPPRPQDGFSYRWRIDKWVQD